MDIPSASKQAIETELKRGRPLVLRKGGAGSGNFGHEGRPGLVGGSAPSGGGGGPAAATEALPRVNGKIDWQHAKLLNNVVHIGKLPTDEGYRHYSEIPKEQRPAAMAKHLFQAAKALEPEATKTLSGLAKTLGGEMAGLEYRLKKQERIEDKIKLDSQEKNIDPHEVIVKDALRYTMVFSTNDYSSKSQMALSELRKQGYEATNIRNYWSGDDYRGTNLSLIKNGFVFELQFHTPESLEVKEKISHPIYEKARRLPIDSPERKALAQRLAEAWHRVAVPVGAMMIKFMRRIMSYKADTSYIEYYASDDNLVLLVRRRPEEQYFFANSAGRWKDGSGLFERYFFNGEDGLDKITIEEARKLADKFGVSLADIKWPPIKQK